MSGRLENTECILLWLCWNNNLFYHLTNFSVTNVILIMSFHQVKSSGRFTTADRSTMTAANEEQIRWGIKIDLLIKIIYFIIHIHLLILQLLQGVHLKLEFMICLIDMFIFSYMGQNTWQNFNKFGTFWYLWTQDIHKWYIIRYEHILSLSQI